MSKGNSKPIWHKALSHLDALYGFAMALTRSRIEAEDLVQDTYLQAMPHFAQLRHDSNLKGWLFTIMRNIWLKKLRHLRNGPDFVAPDQDNVKQQTIDFNDPQALTIRIWEREEIRLALEQLPNYCHEIIVLRDIEGFSYKEMAEILDCPIGAVMSRLTRARAKLKRVLCTKYDMVPKKRNNG